MKPTISVCLRSKNYFRIQFSDDIPGSRRVGKSQVKNSMIITCVNYFCLFLVSEKRLSIGYKNPQKSHYKVEPNDTTDTFDSYIQYANDDYERSTKVAFRRILGFPKTMNLTRIQVVELNLLLNLLFERRRLRVQICLDL